MKVRKFKKARPENSEAGLSALELLIAMAVFLIVMGSVYGILKIGNMSRMSINSRSENIKNVRMAIDTFGREAVNAGLGYNRIGGSVPDDFTTYNFGMPPDADDKTDLLTAISAGFNIYENNLSKNGEKNDVVAFAFRDFQFNDGFPIIITDITSDGNSLILKTPDGACANCRPYDLFLIETGDGKQAVVLSTDIVNQNSIVLGGDPMGVNYGQPGTTSGSSGSDCLLGLLCLGLGTSGGASDLEKSTVKKCNYGETSNCINYSSTTVVAKKIYLVSYNVTKDGTLIRTSFGNNTGAASTEQIVRQPVAKGVRAFKLKYLLSDGTVTEDPSVANTQKERCNEIVQIEVTAIVESEASQSVINSAEPVTLSSTFSTRNLKYDVY